MILVLTYMSSRYICCLGTIISVLDQDYFLFHGQIQGTNKTPLIVVAISPLNLFTLNNRHVRPTKFMLQVLRLQWTLGRRELVFVRSFP